MTSIPQKICDINFEITDEQRVALLYLFSQANDAIKLFSFIEKFKVSNDVIKSLAKLELISIKQDSGVFYIDLNPFFTVHDALNADVVLLDKVSLLLNRQIKQAELDYLNQWLKSGYTDIEIQVAIQKSILNNVDNFKYVNTVLQNTSKQSSGKNVDINRNFDIY